MKSPIAVGSDRYATRSRVRPFTVFRRGSIPYSYCAAGSEALVMLIPSATSNPDRAVFGGGRGGRIYSKDHHSRSNLTEVASGRSKTEPDVSRAWPR